MHGKITCSTFLSYNYCHLHCLCVVFYSVTIKHHGKTTHAWSYPWKGVNALGRSRALLQQPVRSPAADESRLESSWWGAATVCLLVSQVRLQLIVLCRCHQARWTETKHHPWLHWTGGLSEDPHPGWAAHREGESWAVLKISCSSNWLYGINNKQPSIDYMDLAFIFIFLSSQLHNGIVNESKHILCIYRKDLSKHRRLVSVFSWLISNQNLDTLTPHKCLSCSGWGWICKTTSCVSLSWSSCSRETGRL